MPSDILKCESSFKLRTLTKPYFQYDCILKIVQPRRTKNVMTRIKLICDSIFNTLSVSILCDSENIIVCNPYISGRATPQSTGETHNAALCFWSSEPASYHHHLRHSPFEKSLIETPSFPYDATLGMMLLYLSDVSRDGFPSRGANSTTARSFFINALQRSRQRSAYQEITPWHSKPL